MCSSSAEAVSSRFLKLFGHRRYLLNLLQLRVVATPSYPGRPDMVPFSRSSGTVARTWRPLDLDAIFVVDLDGLRLGESRLHFTYSALSVVSPVIKD